MRIAAYAHTRTSSRFPRATTPTFLCHANFVEVLCEVKSLLPIGQRESGCVCVCVCVVFVCSCLSLSVCVCLPCVRNVGVCSVCFLVCFLEHVRCVFVCVRVCMRHLNRFDQIKV